MKTYNSILIFLFEHKLIIEKICIKFEKLFAVLIIAALSKQLKTIKSISHYRSRFVEKMFR